MLFRSHEARLVVDQYRKEKSLAQLYDTVIIPTLTMAEQDRHKGALDTERAEFLFLTLREVIADFGVETRNAESESSVENLRAPSMPGRVVCFPANDEADEIAAVMLAQLLERADAQRFPLLLAHPQ